MSGGVNKVASLLVRILFSPSNELELMDGFIVKVITNGEVKLLKYRVLQYYQLSQCYYRFQMMY